MLLTFGLYVTPDPTHNPIQPPERFIGYHVGLDFEIDPSEAEEEVPVYALCTGPVLSNAWTLGYGGLLIQECEWQSSPITVLYGHIQPSSSTHAVGEILVSGQRIALLGEAKSNDTDGNRKHLHLGIHKGSSIDTLGYVQKPEELDQYLDPAFVLGLSATPALPRIFSTPNQASSSS